MMRMRTAMKIRRRFRDSDLSRSDTKHLPPPELPVEEGEQVDGRRDPEAEVTEREVRGTSPKPIPRASPSRQHQENQDN
eukprot:1228868-Pyramimonas_sp.AAC.1